MKKERKPRDGSAKHPWTLDSSETLWFFNKCYLIYKLVSQSHTYPNVHKRRLARPNSLLLLPLEIVTECRALAHLPTTISSATHPSCLSQERGRSSRGDQAASICLEHLRQKELNTGTLSPTPPHTEACYYHFIPKLEAQEGPRTLERTILGKLTSAWPCLQFSHACLKAMRSLQFLGLPSALCSAHPASGLPTQQQWGLHPAQRW